MDDDKRQEAGVDAAAAEIKALVASGDVDAMRAWFEANRERRVRLRDAGALLRAIRGTP